MKVLVLGASGATGRLVVSRLLEKKIPVTIVIRESAVLPERITEDENITIVKGDIDRFSVERFRDLMRDCDGIVCCLGHTISFKGLFGRPRRLVANAVKKIASALASFDVPKKFVLMSTTAYTNKFQGEKKSFGEKLVFALLEILLPPHKDNMLAGDRLVHEAGVAGKVEWAAVRPDSLFDAETASDYEIHEAKIRSPIFDAGRTSRINVAYFMVDLLLNDNLWKAWVYKTPVIYNKD